MRDLLNAEIVEIQVDHTRKVWINIDGQCAMRINKTNKISFKAVGTEYPTAFAYDFANSDAVEVDKNKMIEYFAEFADDGEILSIMSDGIGTFASLIEVESDDLSAFPNLEPSSYILLTQNDQGFMNLEIIKTIDELAEVRQRFNSSSSF